MRALAQLGGSAGAPGETFAAPFTEADVIGKVGVALVTIHVLLHPAINRPSAAATATAGGSDSHLTFNDEPGYA